MKHEGIIQYVGKEMKINSIAETEKAVRPKNQETYLNAQSSSTLVWRIR